MSLEWHHAAGRLHARLSAPTSGWIAAGFAEAPGLRGARFVIAAPALTPLRVEEHVARVPDHRRIEDLGLAPAIADVAGGHEDGRAWLRFSLPHRHPDGSLPDLAPGASVRTLLAWSHAADFDHHSAFRRHTAVTL